MYYNRIEIFKKDLVKKQVKKKIFSYIFKRNNFTPLCHSQILDSSNICVLQGGIECIQPNSCHDFWNAGNLRSLEASLDRAVGTKEWLGGKSLPDFEKFRSKIFSFGRPCNTDCPSRFSDLPTALSLDHSVPEV
jgi:hypothetical protein